MVDPVRLRPSVDRYRTPVEDDAESDVMEAAEELRLQDHVSRLPFARGGPIFVPGVVGQLTSVSDFKADVLNELQVILGFGWSTCFRLLNFPVFSDLLLRSTEFAV